MHEIKINNRGKRNVSIDVNEEENLEKQLEDKEEENILPEDDIKADEQDRDDARPNDGFLIPVIVVLLR